MDSSCRDAGNERMNEVVLSCDVVVGEKNKMLPLVDNDGIMTIYPSWREKETSKFEL